MSRATAPKPNGAQAHPTFMNAVIQVEDLTKLYGELAAVDRVSFAVAPGATCGLLGGNGAGKTTTIAMLLGLLLPTAGSIRVLGEDILDHRYRVLGRMNFSSPYVDLPHRLTVQPRAKHRTPAA